MKFHCNGQNIKVRCSQICIFKVSFTKTHYLPIKLKRMQWRQYFPITPFLCWIAYYGDLKDLKDAFCICFCNFATGTGPPLQPMARECGREPAEKRANIG